jgi:hypothetical protein
VFPPAIESMIIATKVLQGGEKEGRNVEKYIYRNGR